MDKDKIERICREAGLRPETRERYRDYNIFIADGFSLPPHRAFKRFGVEPFDFERGMYATMWWAGRDESLHGGRHLFCDAFHDIQCDLESKKQRRIRAALLDAKVHIDKWMSSKDA